MTKVSKYDWSASLWPRGDVRQPFSTAGQLVLIPRCLLGSAVKRHNCYSVPALIEKLLLFLMCLTCIVALYQSSPEYICSVGCQWRLCCHPCINDVQLPTPPGQGLIIFYPQMLSEPKKQLWESWIHVRTSYTVNKATISKKLVITVILYFMRQLPAVCEACGLRVILSSSSLLSIQVVQGFQPSGPCLPKADPWPWLMQSKYPTTARNLHIMQSPSSCSRPALKAILHDFQSVWPFCLKIFAWFEVAVYP